MPQAEVVFYREGETVLFDQWLKTLPVKVQAKCLSQMLLLRSHGHELRRPIADFLRDGIYELRPTYQGVHYRILYFFSGKNVVVISHGISKESKVPSIEINRAIERKGKYEANPTAHGWKGQA
jgi:phage-related protein